MLERTFNLNLIPISIRWVQRNPDLWLNRLMFVEYNIGIIFHLEKVWSYYVFSNTAPLPNSARLHWHYQRGELKYRIREQTVRLQGTDKMIDYARARTCDVPHATRPATTLQPTATSLLNARVLPFIRAYFEILLYERTKRAISSCLEITRTKCPW